MHGRCFSLFIVCLVSVFFRLSAAGPFETSARNDHLCSWTSSISNGHTHYMFLHRTTVGRERSFVLFDSLWNKENHLLECITSNNHEVIKSFLSKCWKARDQPFTDLPHGRFNIGTLVEPDGPCVAVGPWPDLSVPVRRSRTISQNGGEISGTPKRSKRAWMIPGTLWCGSGNKASNFSDLGLFEETDKCCREHDHCEQTIGSFEFRFGIFNTNIFTLSHCDCDSKFHRCLRNASERMSDVVGYGYFNVLKMRCFEFYQRLKCSERTWWGMCKHNKMTTYALLREATDYNSTSEDDKLGLSVYHTVSFEDLTVPNDLLMSSDIVTKDASQKHSSASVPGKTLPAPTTETTDSSETKLTDSPLITEQRPTPELFKLKRTYLPATQTDWFTTQTTNVSDSEITDFSKLETSQASNVETQDSLKTEATDVPNTKKTDSSNPETKGLLNLKTTDSSNPETSSSLETTDPPKTEATDLKTDASILEKDLPELQTTDSPKTRITDTSDLLKTQTDLAETKITDTPQINSLKTQTTDSTADSTRDLPQPQTTDSMTDSPKPQTTDSTTDSMSNLTDSPKPQTTDSMTDSAKPQTTTDSTTDSAKPQTTTSTTDSATDSPKPQTTTTDLTTDSPKPQTTDSTTDSTSDSTTDMMTDSPKPQTTTSTTDSTTDSPKPQTTDSTKDSTTDSSKMWLRPEMHTKPKGNLDTCEGYKQLDSCRYKIPAGQEKFGLRNAEHTVMYHCECTARLAKELDAEDEVHKVHFRLLDFVSQSCFVLPQTCTGPDSCSSSSNDAPLIERWSNGAAVWRHLAAPRRKNMRSERKDPRIRLYKKCARLYTKLHTPKNLQEKRSAATV